MRYPTHSVNLGCAIMIQFFWFFFFYESLQSRLSRSWSLLGNSMASVAFNCRKTLSNDEKKPIFSNGRFNRLLEDKVDKK